MSNLSSITDKRRKPISFNALRRRLTAMEVCIPGESRRAYELLRQEYIAHYQPVSVIEWDLIEGLVACRWRKRRIIKLETAIVQEAFNRRHAQVQKKYDDITPDREAALAFRSQCDHSDSMKKLDRQETRLMNHIALNTRLLNECRQNRARGSDGLSPAAEPSAPSIRNELISDIEHQQKEAPEPPSSPADCMVAVPGEPSRP